MTSRKIAIVADDVEMNRELLHDMLEDEYSIVEAADGKQVLDIIHEQEEMIRVLLLDLVMPNLDGFGVLEQLQAEGKSDRFPILIISGESDVKTEERCLKFGVTDFIHKPFTPSLVKHRVTNAVTLYTARDSLEQTVAEKTAELVERNARLSRVNEDTIELLGNLVEARSMESGTHIRRVKGFTKLLAQQLKESYPELGISDEDVKIWARASAMHDVGKIMVPDNILLKPGRFTPEEFAEMKKHTVYGCDVLESSRHLWDANYYHVCWQICRYHHEKWDGRGYPDGLKEDAIPLVAQVVSIADCYDALTTERVYKKAFTPDEAYTMIMNGECGQFNPILFETLCQCRESFRQLVIETQQQSEEAQ